jgi:hypothetical protein
MEIESTLRDAFAMREPPADFEDAVMARVSAAAWRAGQRGSRGVRRIVLMGAVFVVVSAAAMMAAWRAASPPEPQQVLVQPVMAVPQPTAAQVASPVVPAMVPQHPPAGTSADDICAEAVATRAPTVYSVQVQPLRFETDDPAMQASVREYYGAMLELLKKIPGLALVPSGGSGIDARPVDYRITLIGLPVMDTPNRELADPVVRQLVEKWTGSSFARFTDSQLSRRYDCVRIDGATPPSPHEADCDIALLARMNVPALQLPSYPTAAQAECSRARSAKVPPARSLMVDTTLAKEFIDGLKGKPPTYRLSSLSIFRNLLKPEMVPALVASLHQSTDEAFRAEVVNLLAAKFPQEPAAREALAAVAATNADTLQGHVAQRALTGEGPWRDYAMAAIRNTSLPTESGSNRCTGWSRP